MVKIDHSCIEWSTISSSVFTASDFFCFDELVCRPDDSQKMGFSGGNSKDLQHDRPRGTCCDARWSFLHFLRSNFGYSLPLHRSHSQCWNVPRIWGSWNSEAFFKYKNANKFDNTEHISAFITYQQYAVTRATIITLARLLFPMKLSWLRKYEANLLSKVCAKYICSFFHNFSIRKTWFFLHEWIYLIDCTFVQQ